MDIKRNAIYGLAIGDALGVPYEFMKRGTFKCTGMTGYGTHNQPAGTWSDDTSMTIATAKSIRDKGCIDVEDIRRNFLDFMQSDEYTIDGLFDIGITTMESLLWGPKDDIKANGNGSLMRILPLAFTDCMMDEVKAVSAITHKHIISTTACVIYVLTAKMLLQGSEIKDVLPVLNFNKPFNRLKTIGKLSADDINSSGYVVDTLEACLWSLTVTDNFRDAVLTAVNLGGDTDTIGAVTGGLAGIMYGVDDEWLSQLRGKDVIESCL